MICKNCSKNFHTCSNCSMLYNWEYDYCTEKCYKDSKEFKQIYENLKTIVCKLDKKEIETFKYYLESEYCFIVDEIEKEN